LDAGLVELSKGDYALATTMPNKKHIFSNWMDRCMFGEDCLVNKHTRLDKYAMPLLEEIFDAFS
jgi:hypothetical protein